MNIVSKTDEQVVISGTMPEMSLLSMLLDWIIDNRMNMDDGMIPLKEEDIVPSVIKWRDFVNDEVLR